MSSPGGSTHLVARLNALGLRHKGSGRYARARGCYRRALRLAGGTGGHDREAISTLCHNLGGIEFVRGNDRAAETWARLGLELRLGLVGARRTDIAADEAALAAILSGIGKYEEAETLYRSALRVFESDGRSALEIAGIVANLGAHLTRQGRWHEALALLRHAVARKRRLPGSHADLAILLNNLAVILRRCGRPEQAAAAGSEALAILTRTRGANHPLTVACRRNHSSASRHPDPPATTCV